MGMGIDHCIHCAFHVWCLICYMIVCCVVWIMYMVKCIWKKGILGLENITLGVWEKNERDSLGCWGLLVVGICITS